MKKREIQLASFGLPDNLRVLEDGSMSDGDVYYQLVRATEAASKRASGYYLVFKGLPHRIDRPRALEKLIDEHIGVRTSYWIVPTNAQAKLRTERIAPADLPSHFDELISTSISGDPVLVAEVKLDFPESTYGDYDRRTFAP